MWLRGSTLVRQYDRLPRCRGFTNLQHIHPGSIRYMDSGQWCSDVADEIAATGNRRWCGANSWKPGVGWPAMGYNDVLQLGHFLGTDVLISVGQLNQPSDWSMLINWLTTSGWISNYSSIGTQDLSGGRQRGMELRRRRRRALLWQWHGLRVHTLGPNMAAAKSASGYNPKVIKLVANGWVAPNQGYGPYGWVHNVLTLAQATPNGLPDFVDDAPYMLNYLGNFNTSGVKVSTTGAPFLDEWAEIANVDSVITTSNFPESMYLNQQYVKSTFGVNTLVYEVNESTTGGVAATQTQLDQIDASVGNALAMAAACAPHAAGFQSHWADPRLHLGGTLQWI